MAHVDEGVLGSSSLRPLVPLLFRSRALAWSAIAIGTTERAIDWSGRLCSLSSRWRSVFLSSFFPPRVSDAFDDAGDGEQTLVKDGAKGNYVHIRIQQRNGRKSLTTVQGLAIDLDLKKILKALKKVGAGDEQRWAHAGACCCWGGGIRLAWCEAEFARVYEVLNTSAAVCLSFVDLLDERHHPGR